MTGGRLIAQELGIRLENVMQDDLGRIVGAVSVAGVLLLTEAVMTEVPDPKPEALAAAMDAAL